MLGVSPDHSPQRVAELAEAYQAYVNGGHIEADAKLAAAADNFRAQERQQQADDEMARALFGVDGAGSSPNESVDEERTAKVTDMVSDGNGGTRGRWVELFESDNSETEKEKQPQVSLLD